MRLRADPGVPLLVVAECSTRGVGLEELHLAALITVKITNRACDDHQRFVSLALCIAGSLLQYIYRACDDFCR